MKNPTKLDMTDDVGRDLVAVSEPINPEGVLEQNRQWLITKLEQQHPTLKGEWRGNLLELLSVPGIAQGDETLAVVVDFIDKARTSGYHVAYHPEGDYGSEYHAALSKLLALIRQQAAQLAEAQAELEQVRGDLQAAVDAPSNALMRQYVWSALDTLTPPAQEASDAE